MVICLERGADLHMAQLMPLPLTFSCFSKIQIGLPFWYWPTRVVPEKGPLNRCVCVCLCFIWLSKIREIKGAPTLGVLQIFSNGLCYQVHDVEQPKSADPERAQVVLVGEAAASGPADAPVLPHDRVELRRDRVVAGVADDGSGLRRRLPAEFGADRRQRVRGLGCRPTLADSRLACPPAARERRPTSSTRPLSAGKTISSV